MHKKNTECLRYVLKNFGGLAATGMPGLPWGITPTYQKASPPLHFPPEFKSKTQEDRGDASPKDTTAQTPPYLALPSTAQGLGHLTLPTPKSHPTVTGLRMKVSHAQVPSFWCQGTLEFRENAGVCSLIHC